MPLSKTSDPRDHYVELDALRGIAILTVVLSHVVGGWVRQTKIPVTVPLLGVDAANLLSFMAAHGVSLFFLLRACADRQVANVMTVDKKPI